MSSSSATLWATSDGKDEQKNPNNPCSLLMQSTHQSAIARQGTLIAATLRGCVQAIPDSASSTAGSSLLSDCTLVCVLLAAENIFPTATEGILYSSNIGFGYHTFSAQHSRFELNWCFFKCIFGPKGLVGCRQRCPKQTELGAAEAAFRFVSLHMVTSLKMAQGGYGGVHVADIRPAACTKDCNVDT